MFMGDAPQQFYKSPTPQKTQASGGGPLVNCADNPNDPGCARVIANAQQQNEQVLQSLNPINAIDNFARVTGHYFPWIVGGVAALIVLPLVFGRR